MAIIEEPFKRRVCIKGKPDDATGCFVSVTDADTHEVIENVTCAVIYLNPTKLNEVELTYFRGDRPYAGPDGKPVIGKVRSENPIVDITAYEGR